MGAGAPPAADLLTVDAVIVTAEWLAAAAGLSEFSTNPRA
jgi:hypothetical protein